MRVLFLNPPLIDQFSRTCRLSNEGAMEPKYMVGVYEDMKKGLSIMRCMIGTRSVCWVAGVS